MHRHDAAELDPGRRSPERGHLLAAHGRLVRAGHVAPVVAVTTSDGCRGVGDPHARFEIGSITKVFTATLLAELARTGAVRLDDTLADHLGPRTDLAPGVGAITLEHLASHRSGLPRLPPGIARRALSRTGRADPYADVDGARLLETLAHVRLRRAPGRGWPHYSNLGVGLLGYVLGRATGTGFEAALTQHVLVPLGLRATSFSDEDLRPGHYRREEVGPWHLAALAGAGGLRSSAADLLTLLEAVRDGGTPLDEAIAETLRPRCRGRFRVGLGWWLMPGGLVMHDGGTLGARSQAWLNPGTGTGAVVLGDARGGTGAVARSLVRS